MSETMFTATLTKGETYYLRDRRFERGVPEPVTADEKEWLEEHATDVATLTDSDGGKEAVIRQKFTFAEMTPEEAAKAAPKKVVAAPRLRKRSEK